MHTHVRADTHTHTHTYPRLWHRGRVIATHAAVPGSKSCRGRRANQDSREVGWLLIFSSNSGIESQQRLGDSTCWQHITPKLAGWSFNSVCGQGEVRLIVVGRPWSSMNCRSLGFYLCIFIYISEYQCFHIFLCLKYYFPSPFFPVYPSHVVNSLLSHPSCYFLHHEFRDLPFLLLQRGHHSKIFWGSLSLFILRTWH